MFNKTLSIKMQFCFSSHRKEIIFVPTLYLIADNEVTIGFSFLIWEAQINISKL